MPLLPLIAAKSQKRQRHSAGKAGEPPPDQGSIPGCGRSFSHQTVSGTALAGDAHSLARRINPLQLVK